MTVADFSGRTAKMTTTKDVSKMLEVFHGVDRRSPTARGSILRTFEGVTCMLRSIFCPAAEDRPARDTRANGATRREHFRCADDICVTFPHCPVFEGELIHA